MTAAYMTRCVYLTFFGEYRGSVAHELAEVHEAEVLAEGDELVEHHLAEEQDDVRARLRSARTTTTHARTARTRATASSPCRCGSCRSSRCSRASSTSRTSRSSSTGSSRASRSSRCTPAKFNVVVAVVSVAIALAGVGARVRSTTGRRWARSGSAERNPLARAGKHFLVMKYYLDVLYTDIIVASIKGPIAAGVYWFNQHVIDNVLNYAGTGAVGLGPVHVRVRRPARCRRRRQRHRDRDRRVRRRGAPGPDRPVAVLRLDPGPRGGAVRPVAVDLHVSGGDSAR